MTRLACPDELLAPFAPAPPAPADIALEATDETLGWIAARFAWGDALAALLADARSQCPK